MKHIIFFAMIALSSFTSIAGDVYPMDQISDVAIESWKAAQVQGELAENKIDVAVYKTAWQVERQDLDIIVAPKGSPLEARYLNMSSHSIQTGHPIAMVTYMFPQMNCAMQVGIDVETLKVVVPPTHDCL